MPTLPVCLNVILVMGPEIQELGVSVLTAHMSVFYYGVASSLTPPVATAAYAAALVAALVAGVARIAWDWRSSKLRIEQQGI